MHIDWVARLSIYYIFTLSEVHGSDILSRLVGDRKYMKQNPSPHGKSFLLLNMCVHGAGEDHFSLDCSFNLAMPASLWCASLSLHDPMRVASPTLPYIYVYMYIFIHIYIIYIYIYYIYNIYIYNIYNM